MKPSTMTRFSLLSIFLVVVILSGCSGGGNVLVPDPGKTTDNSPPPEWLVAMMSKVGVYDLRQPLPPVMDYQWYPDKFEPYKEVTETVFLESDNGNKIMVHVHKPSFASNEKPCHALVMIPGGSMKGNAWHAPWRHTNSKHLAQTGFINVDYDAQGRGQSEGIEDWNGPIHRQDLKTVINWLNERKDVLTGGVGVITSSWGITVATATLAEYPDLKVRFLIDLEGAHDRFSSTQWDDPKWIDLMGGYPTSDDEFWSEREAITFMPNVAAPYIRLQSDMDHALDIFYVDHAIELVNAGVNGLSPYSRLNHYPPNTTLDLLNPGIYPWKKVDELDDYMYDYIIEASMTKYPSE